jgi:glycine cleavage system H lipoate-binding protein
MTPDDRRYPAEHARVRPTGPDTVRIGITDPAARNPSAPANDE